MESKTKYRIISKGIHRFLEYHKNINFLFLRWKRWSKIPYPSNFEFQSVDYIQYVSDYNHRLHDFAKNYPDIAEYYKMEYIALRNSTYKLYSQHLNDLKQNKKTIEYL